jgi:uncharacterized protein
VGSDIFRARALRDGERIANRMFRRDVVLDSSGWRGRGGNFKKVMVKTQHLGLGAAAASACAFNATRGQILATQVDVVRKYQDRITGLLGRETFRVGQGMHIVPSDSIHTVGMRFSIDVLFLDENGIVLDKWPDVQPGRTGVRCFKAISTLELPAGVINGTGTRTGDKIEFSEATC